MNKLQRKNLQAAIDGLMTIVDAEDAGFARMDLGAIFDQAKSIVSTAADEECEKYDNMPEGLQNSEQGEKLSENIEELEGIEWPLMEDYDMATEGGRDDLRTDAQDVIDIIEGTMY